MAHFAKINADGLVEQVLVVHNDEAPTEEAGQAFLQGLFGPSTWVQTSYNGSIRKNFAGIGHHYDAARDAFIAPAPYPSWTLDEATCRWVPPIARPQGAWLWDEAAGMWVPE